MGELIVLGCGGSSGVPAIGGWWGACDPHEPRNIRTRPSIALKTDTTLIVVDTGPDFREQMNRERLGCPDAVIITHIHSDHINGLDELRTFQRLNKGRKFPVYTDAYTLEKLTERLDYMFTETEGGFYPAVCLPEIVTYGRTLTIGDITLTLFEQDHGTISSLGLRIGDIGYSTDMKRLDDAALTALAGIHTWIVDAAGHHSRSNPVHACIEELIELNNRIGAKEVLLTHLPPTMDYATLMKELPQGFMPAFDGMRVVL